MSKRHVTHWGFGTLVWQWRWWVWSTHFDEETVVRGFEEWVQRGHRGIAKS